ncbi:MAG: RNA polymerase sigma factor [Lachnospiraceae bacterium]|nr:RNA polymerase sigma factor [Lachnospiraceae bacterium]
MRNSERKKVHIDKKLMERIQKGQNGAFEELYELTNRVLYAYLLSCTKNAEDAKDLLQESFLQIYKDIRSYKNMGKPMAWMMTIAKNQFLMKYRKEKNEKEQTVYVESDELEQQIGCSGLESVEERLLITKMFETLETDDRNIIIMHAVGGMKFNEIAEIMQWPMGTVISHYYRSTKMLKSTFRKGGQNEK